MAEPMAVKSTAAVFFTAALTFPHFPVTVKKIRKQRKAAIALI